MSLAWMPGDPEPDDLRDVLRLMAAAAIIAVGAVVVKLLS